MVNFYVVELVNGLFFFFFQAEDGIRDWSVTGVQTCALPIYSDHGGVVYQKYHIRVRANDY